MMTARNMPVAQTLATGVAQRVAGKVEDALRNENAVAAGAVALSARVAGTAVALIAGLTDEARRRLDRHEGELVGRLRSLLESFGDEADTARLDIEFPAMTEPRKGSGLGDILGEDEGRRALSDFAATKRLEDWAGPVAGASVLARDYGISRSSLNRWQHAGDVIGLLKGVQKHVYPVDQFIDGRPARGIAQVSALSGNQRIAWLWLSRGNAALGGKRPIDLLKRDMVAAVIEAAQNYFNPA
jgi:hypothetical protein